MGSDLEFFVVYHNPSDFPGKFVVRRQVVGPNGIKADEDTLCVALTLDEARSVIPAGLYRQERHPDDTPVIVEVWF
jgi:hypothetical protein